MKSIIRHVNYIDWWIAGVNIAIRYQLIIYFKPFLFIRLSVEIKLVLRILYDMALHSAEPKFLSFFKNLLHFNLQIFIVTLEK